MLARSSPAGDGGFRHLISELGWPQNSRVLPFPTLYYLFTGRDIPE